MNAERWGTFAEYVFALSMGMGFGATFAVVAYMWLNPTTFSNVLIAVPFAIVIGGTAISLTSLGIGSHFASSCERGADDG